MKNIVIGNRVYRISESLYQELYRLSNTNGLDPDVVHEYESERCKILTNIEDFSEPILIIDSTWQY